MPRKKAVREVKVESDPYFYGPSEPSETTTGEKSPVPAPSEDVTSQPLTYRLFLKSYLARTRGGQTWQPERWYRNVSLSASDAAEIQADPYFRFETED